MKTKLILFLALLALCSSGVRATITQPTLTTDVNNPHYYTIKNKRSNKYATYTGPNSQLSQISSPNYASLWYFVENGTGVNIVPALDPTVKLQSTTSATSDGIVWYLKESYNAGYFCVSKSSTDVTGGETTTADCWDDQGSNTTIGYWKNVKNDAEGTSWVIEASAITLSEVIGYRRDQILPTINALPELLRPAEKMTALNSAATDADFREAVANFSANVTLKCRSDKYLVVGNTAGSFVSTPSNNEEIIQLVSVGDGSFYIRGYISMKYMGDVQESVAINTEPDSNTPYYIQAYNGYTVARPTKYTDSGRHYIHNGGSGCVGWQTNAANTQFTLEFAELPAGYCGVTYNIKLNDNVVATVNERQLIGAATAVPSGYLRDYTTYAYDVATIPDASSTTVTATATVSGLPFKISTDYNNATWYKMQLHTGWQNYVSMKEDYTISWASGSKSSDEYYWAFFGNPIEGFNIINRAAGNSMYLTSTNPVTVSTTATAWTLNYKDATHFGLSDDSRGSSKYANGQDNTLKFWWDFDNGSQFWITEVSEDELEFVDDIKELESYTYGDNIGQYSFTGVYAELKGLETSKISELKASGYTSANLTTAQGYLTATVINQPVGKFIRMYNAADARYWGVSASSGYTKTEPNIQDAGIFYINDIGGTNHVLNYQNGLYVANNAGALNAAVGNTGATFTFSESATKGRYYVHNGGGYLVSWHHNDIGYHIDRLGALSSEVNKSYGTWEIAEVLSLPVTLSNIEGHGFASFYTPVGISSLPDGVKAYIASVDGDRIRFTNITDIPANTGVILYQPTYTEGAVNLTIGDASSTTTGNVLNGIVASTPLATVKTDLSATNILTMQNDGTKGLGFYQYNGTNLNGFRVFVDSNDAVGVKSFVFDFDDDDATGIVSLLEKTEEGTAIYNIAGQRLSKMQKGINIVNGKKILK